MRLGQRFMTILQNAMINVQLKKTGTGIFTCFYENKSITDDLATYFLIQKEVDFIEVGFDKRYPERCVDNDVINKTQENYLDHRDFEKDMDELDLSGLEYDIENVEEIAQKDSYNYVTQIYVYIRIDEEYVSINKCT
ncbi:hypothetical protein PFNF54_00435 [Plasmodium falciparum NF54]|uniref:Uncharacterized protein n=1 Tax=Plasmodium falciparum (isolate NF54) TaxID=5843 RepID=W7KCT2_PLAFO|nr:hypothetical protein PFNF54_00435 [Plasmodium falciparum NF54]